MRDVVLLPVYDRPEYAWVCLEYLSRARGIEDKEVWLCQDLHYGNYAKTMYDMFPVVQFAASLFTNVKYNMHDPHDTYGNSQNLLDSMKSAHDSGAERVFIVEDDIMVAPDIFEWHEEVLRVADPFVSCATAVNKSANFQVNGPEAMDDTYQNPNAYYKSMRAYSSHASAFKRENLGLLIERMDYNLEWGSWRQGVEQDGLIQHLMCNVVDFITAGSAWPYVPRAWNTGLYSYHIQNKKLEGTLEDKVSRLRETIKDPVKLKEAAGGNDTVTAIPRAFPVRTGPLIQVQKYR